MASLVVGVEDLVAVAEEGHCLVVVVLRRGYDPAWALLVDLRGEADKPKLALVVVVGVGNCRIAIA